MKRRFFLSAAMSAALLFFWGATSSGGSRTSYMATGPREVHRCKPDPFGRADGHRGVEGAGDHGEPAAEPAAYHRDRLHPSLQVNGGLEDAQPSMAVSYLIERMNKRALRLETARKGTSVAVSQLADQERTLLFTLRSAFIQVLQQKAILTLAIDNLAYYDRVIDVSNERFRTGDIARVDLDRLHSSGSRMSRT